MTRSTPAWPSTDDMGGGLISLGDAPDFGGGPGRPVPPAPRMETRPWPSGLADEGKGSIMGRVARIAAVVGGSAVVGAAAWGWAARGPRSQRARYDGQVRAQSAVVAAARLPRGVVTEAELSGLPGPAARWLRHAGVVGRPRPLGFTAAFHGRIRGGAAEPWMPFTSTQTNTFGPAPSRLFLLDAVRGVMPVRVLHEYVDGRASMEVRLLSALRVARAAGTQMDQSEMVTALNDMCAFAPGALLDPRVMWEAVDDTHVGVTFTDAGHAVRAVLTIDEVGRLVDFVSDDRHRLGAGDAPTVIQRWSTPFSAFTRIEGQVVPKGGQAVWHEPDGPLPYLELELDRLELRW